MGTQQQNVVVPRQLPASDGSDGPYSQANRLDDAIDDSHRQGGPRSDVGITQVRPKPVAGHEPEAVQARHRDKATQEPEPLAGDSPACWSHRDAIVLGSGRAVACPTMSSAARSSLLPYPVSVA